MKRRPGFLMAWTLTAMTLIFILLGGVTFALYTALSWEMEREGPLDEVLIAQDAMEREKYNVRSGGNEPSLSGDVLRNGRHYRVHVSRMAVEERGISLIRIRCHVAMEGREGTDLVTLVESAASEGKGL